MKNLTHILSFVLTVTATSLFGYNGSGSLISGSITRTFSFHSAGASAPAANLPLLIIMHGDGGNGAAIKGYSGFDAVADAENFIAVYPDAVNSTWNRYVDNVPGDAGLGNPNAPDDVAFISAMIDYFCSTYHINPSKVYATGHSAGGFMAYNLAISLPSKVAAIAPVAASLWGDNTYINNYFSTSYTAIPVYHVHGDADGTVSYPDPNNTADAWGEWPLSGFGNANCSNNTYIASTDLVAGSVKKLAFCTSGKEISLIRIIGGGHGWPTVGGYNTASAIWNFCKTYSITTSAACSTPTDISDLSQTTGITLFPNPSTGVFSIHTTSPIHSVTIYDVLGKTISLTQVSNEEYHLSSPAQGLFLVEVLTENHERFIQRLLIE